MSGGLAGILCRTERSCWPSVRCRRGERFGHRRIGRTPLEDTVLEPIPPQMRRRLENGLQNYGERKVTEAFKANEPDIAQATIPLVRLQQILRDQAKRKPSNMLVRLV